MPRRVLERGATVGRYIVVEQLGAGGMGVVYAAYDPELGRKVALKLLRADAGQPRSPQRAPAARGAGDGAARHPNVVAVYDVGASTTACSSRWSSSRATRSATWLAAAAPRWREIARRSTRRPGAGSRPRTRAGIVHRDFKPDNVLVDARRRVRVADFGLARPAATSARRDRDSDDGEPRADDSRRHSRCAHATGAVVGTPAYMAPELAWRHRVRHGDQFSFCVALYEALYGERPFAGTTAKELAHAALHGELRAVPRPSRVQTRIERALTRGLAADPAKRFPTLEALLAELSRTPRHRLRGDRCCARGRYHGGRARVSARTPPTNAAVRR